jgi:hypothetical protein
MGCKMDMSGGGTCETVGLRVVVMARVTVMGQERRQERDWQGKSNLENL